MTLPASLQNDFTLMSDIPTGNLLECRCVRRKTSGELHVLQMLPASFMGNAEIQERFRDFFMSYDQILPCCIARREDLKKSGGVWYALEEYSSGVPLTEGFLRSLTPDSLFHLFAEICEALNNAHNRGVRHLCLSPQCLLADETKKVTVRGFGLAIFAETRLLNGLGAQYRKHVAPEVLRRGEIHNSSDVYSLASTIVELCPQFRANPWLNKALSDDPSQRYSGMLEMEESLSLMLARPPSDRKPASPVEILIIRSDPPGASLEVVNGSYRQSCGTSDAAMRFELREPDKSLTISATKDGFLPRTVNFDTPPDEHEIIVTLESLIQYVTIKTEPPEAIVKDALTGNPIGCTYAGIGVTIPWAPGAKLLVDKEGFRTRRLKLSADRPSRPIVSTIELEPVCVKIWTNPSRVEIRDNVSDELLGITDGNGGLPVIWERGRELLLLREKYRAQVHKLPSVAPTETMEERLALEPVEASVTTNPDGAQLIDRATGVTLVYHCYPKFPVRVSWRPGSDIWVEKEGYESVQLHWGNRTENFSIHFDLERKKSRDTIRVRVISDPVGASVTVDGQFLGVTQATGTQWKIAPGMRTIELRKRGYRNRTVATRIPNKRSHVVGPVKLKPQPITVITHPAQALVRTSLGVVGKTSSEGLKVPWHSGPITVEKPGYLTVAKAFTEPPESMLLEVFLDRVPVENPKPRPTKPPEKGPAEPQKPDKPDPPVPPQRASGRLTRLFRWLYPHELPADFPSLLMTKDWGIPEERLDKKEARQRGLVLYKGRWTTKSECKLLRKQFRTCFCIRAIALTFLVFTALVELPFLGWSGPIDILVSLLILVSTLFISTSLWRFRTWAHYVAGLVFLLFMPLVGVPLSGFLPAVVAVLMAWVLGIWALSNSVAQQIFSRKVRETDTQ